MKPALTLFVLALLLVATASAADRTTGTFMQHATEGYYFMYSDNGYVEISAYTFKTPSGDPRAHVWVYWIDGPNDMSLIADGDVPTSMMKVTGNALAVNIPDLAALPGMYINKWGSGTFPDTLPINFVWTPISIYKADFAGQVTERDPTTGAKMIKFFESYTQTWASVEGVIVTFTFPQSSIGGEYGYLKAGDYDNFRKSHYVK